MKIIWVSIYVVVFIWSAILPEDYFTWFLEVLPAIIGLIVLVFTYNKFRLTRLTIDRRIGGKFSWYKRLYMGSSV